MANKVACPFCKKEIDATKSKCPSCKKELEVLFWEIETESGNTETYKGEGAEKVIRKKLLSGELKLSDRCRQYVNRIVNIEAGEAIYELKKDKGWKSVKESANKVLTLQELYNPTMAHGKEAAKIAWAIVGLISAVAYLTYYYTGAGHSGFIALLFGIGTIIISATGVGLLILAFIGGMNMLIQILIAMIAGVAIGAVVGWTFGLIIGAIVGSRKEKLLEG
jgi:hypothetical protein